MSVQVAVKNGEPLYQPALDALIALFFRKESEAQKEEASTDDILTNSTEKKDTKPVSTSESQSSSQESKDSESSSVQDIIDKLIETAGKHMENSMIGAHISLLIAYLIMNSEVSFRFFVLYIYSFDPPSPINTLLSSKIIHAGLIFSLRTGQHMSVTQCQILGFSHLWSC